MRLPIGRHTCFPNLSVGLASSDVLSLRWRFSFHGRLSLKTLKIARDCHDSQDTSTFLIGHCTIAGFEATVDFDSIPVLSMAHVVDGHIVVLTPEERNSIKFLTAAKNVLGCHLPLTLSDHPMLDANSLAGVWIRPAGDVAGSENSGGTGFQVFVDCDTPIDVEPSLLGQSQRWSHSYAQYQKVHI